MRGRWLRETACMQGFGGYPEVIRLLVCDVSHSGTLLPVPPVSAPRRHQPHQKPRRLRQTSETSESPGVTPTSPDESPSRSDGWHGTGSAVGSGRQRSRAQGTVTGSGTAGLVCGVATDRRDGAGPAQPEDGRGRPRTAEDGVQRRHVAHDGTSFKRRPTSGPTGYGRLRSSDSDTAAVPQ